MLWYSSMFNLHTLKSITLLVSIMLLFLHQMCFSFDINDKITSPAVIKEDNTEINKYAVRVDTGDGSLHCQGVYTQQGVVLTSEKCVVSLEEYFDLNMDVSFYTGSGQQLLIDEDSFKSHGGLGFVKVDDIIKLKDLEMVSVDCPVEGGADATVLNFQKSVGSNYKLEMLKTKINFCSSEDNICYLNDHFPDSGAPVFIDNALFCIGTGTDGECRKVDAARHLSKRSTADGCSEESDGSCRVLKCDPSSDFCSQCYGHQSCTVKNGDCDGKNLFRK